MIERGGEIKCSNKEKRFASAKPYTHAEETLLKWCAVTQSCKALHSAYAVTAQIRSALLPGRQRTHCRQPVVNTEQEAAVHEVLSVTVLPPQFPFQEAEGEIRLGGRSGDDWGAAMGWAGLGGGGPHNEMPNGRGHHKVSALNYTTHCYSDLDCNSDSVTTSQGRPLPKKKRIIITKKGMMLLQQSRLTGLAKLCFYLRETAVSQLFLPCMVPRE